MSAKKKSKGLDRRKALAKIHICKGKLGMRDDAYREMLLELTGKESCSQMSDKELRDVLDHLTRFVDPSEDQGERSGDLGRSQNLRIVYAKAKKHLGADWRKRLTGLAERVAGKSAPEWCSNQELISLLSAIGKIGRRENVPEKH